MNISRLLENGKTTEAKSSQDAYVSYFTLLLPLSKEMSNSAKSFDDENCFASACELIAYWQQLTIYTGKLVSTISSDDLSSILLVKLREIGFFCKKLFRRMMIFQRRSGGGGYEHC